MRAAQALAVAAWARAIKRDRSATADLETACAVMESADDRDILIGSMTALGMVLSSSDLPGSLVLRERSLAMARAEGLVYIESWTVTCTSCRKRASVPADTATARSSLTAISRSSTRSCAQYTTALPPRPISSVTS